MHRNYESTVDKLAVIALLLSSWYCSSFQSTNDICGCLGQQLRCDTLRHKIAFGGCR